MYQIYIGLAKAFNDILHYHPKLVDIIKYQFGVNDPSSLAYKMAQIPQKASLKFGLNPSTGKLNTYPYIVLENVYVFPGSPVFFENSFQSLYQVNVLMKLLKYFFLIYVCFRNCYQ